MQRQFILIIALLFALATAAALLFSKFESTTDNDGLSKGALITQSLSSEPQANSLQIKEIIITHKGQVKLHGFQADGEWLAKHLSSDTPFPLQKQALIELVRSLVNANIVEYKSAKPTNHAKLGLADIGPQNPDTYRVTLVTGDAKDIDILIGKASSLQAGQYVRYENQNQMLLIDQSISLPSTDVDWLDQGLFNFNILDIGSVARISNDEAENWRFSAVGLQSQTADFVLSGLNEDESLSYPAVLANYVSAINDLSFTDVAPLNEIEWGSKKPILSLTIENKQGQVSRLNVVNDNGTFVANFAGHGKYIRLNEWLFTLPEYQVEALLKARGDFIKVPPETNAQL